MESKQDEVGLPEAAILMGVSWPVAWRLVLKGQLPAQKRRGRWFVRVPDAERLASELSKPLAPTT